MRDGRLWEIRVHWKLLVLNTNIVRSFAWVTIQTRTPPVQANRSFARKRTIDARTHARTHPPTHARTHARTWTVDRTHTPSENKLDFNRLKIDTSTTQNICKAYVRFFGDTRSLHPPRGGGGGREGEDSQYARERSSPPLLLHFGG